MQGKDREFMQGREATEPFHHNDLIRVVVRLMRQQLEEIMPPHIKEQIVLMEEFALKKVPKFRPHVICSSSFREDPLKLARHHGFVHFCLLTVYLLDQFTPSFSRSRPH